MTFWEFINKYYDCYIVVDTETQRLGRLSFSMPVKFVAFWMIREYGNCVVDFKQIRNVNNYKAFEVTIRDEDK